MFNYLICGSIPSSLMQEEIKINSVTIFVNPYTEPDEEEEQEKAKEEDADNGENVRICTLSICFPCIPFILFFSYKTTVVLCLYIRIR